MTIVSRLLRAKFKRESKPEDTRINVHLCYINLNYPEFFDWKLTSKRGTSPKSLSKRLF